MAPMSRSCEGVLSVTPVLLLLLAAISALATGAPLSHAGDTGSSLPAAISVTSSADAGQMMSWEVSPVTSPEAAAGGRGGGRHKRQYGDITINEKLVAYLLNKHLPKNCRRVGCGSVDVQKSGRRKKRSSLQTESRDRRTVTSDLLLHILR